MTGHVRRQPVAGEVWVFRFSTAGRGQGRVFIVDVTDGVVRFRYFGSCAAGTPATVQAFSFNYKFAFASLDGVAIDDTLRATLRVGLPPVGVAR